MSARIPPNGGIRLPETSVGCDSALSFGRGFAFGPRDVLSECLISKKAVVTDMPYVGLGQQRLQGVTVGSAVRERRASGIAAAAVPGQGAGRGAAKRDKIHRTADRRTVAGASGIKAQSYWERRLAVAKASDGPDEFRAEIGSIGLWVLWNVEPDWLLEQLLAILAADYAPNDIYSVVDKLSKMDVEKIDRVVEVLSALVSSPHVNRLTLMVQPGPMRKMLVAGKATVAPKTRSLVTNIVNILASKGDDSYMDLLD
ncbi:hypothetical protein [Bradyrhizobium sp. 170]|uniref:hypothetical protein n=1 Tax=Bradyrhizobium sp. 170 TaxID=2782641 RepID=UPI001FFEB4D8|nr:hypothetical protein [Bradyrhizobium sp. 170]UPK01442.1 hypothetical protein IVB05_27695 [Bradyrhizobium sp. 170]